jgi:hypothetical protein
MRQIFFQKLLQDDNKTLVVSFNHTFRYIDDVLSMHNRNFHNYVHLIYPDKLKIKDTTESDISASYLNISLDIDSNERLTTTLHDKRDDFNFAIFNFLFYVVIYHFHLLMVCVSPGWFDTQYMLFSKQRKLLTNKLILQGYSESRLK